MKYEFRIKTINKGNKTFYELEARRQDAKKQWSEWIFFGPAGESKAYAEDLKKKAEKQYNPPRAKKVAAE